MTALTVTALTVTALTVTALTATALTATGGRRAVEFFAPFAPCRIVDDRLTRRTTRRVTVVADALNPDRHSRGDALEARRDSV
ncbi:hypothetical protein [Winogradskya consettensis]|uniref:hypothetical protein n=1 Tax=Winogradskya consettensis TaxID=113560 RepID=UPI001BB3A816|nr:hypothetical protein [Actinoplanes consettensis]